MEELFTNGYKLAGPEIVQKLLKTNEKVILQIGTLKQLALENLENSVHERRQRHVSLALITHLVERFQRSRRRTQKQHKIVGRNRDYL